MTLLNALPRVDPETGAVLAVVETPRGSRNKYKYDVELKCIRLASVLPQGTVFPYDFGFVPSTKAADGDPLDIMILMDEIASAGCVISVRVIGAIEAEQRAKGGDWVRNDRLLGVSVQAHAHASIESIADIDPKLLEELEGFFEHYNRLHDKEFRVLERVGPKKALKLIEKVAV
ncbi:inorganic diphosphatase [Methylocystis sp. B8]|uniref:inorganic diphosphatase n=1 Tax=Methylocystis sp. B8 TaxID=544938 RepID=UPI0010FDD14E|nr:inorganic diphosphatase [Methylocystis sp. B8]TLG71826.1 inorganic diphosphatase [Methylocystis sp. B8]